MTLTYAIKEGFAYERRTEPGTQPPALKPAAQARAPAATSPC